tara:strand:- start:15 stop:161 length:147 start_codon:yes stop_codon:yes gene_type:complete
MKKNTDLKAIKVRAITEFLLWLNSTDHVSLREKSRQITLKMEELAACR